MNWQLKNIIKPSSNTMEQNNAKRFLDAYARIESKLNEIENENHYLTFNQLLFRTAKKNHVISNHLQVLKEYNELRNAIVHQRGPSVDIVAIPTDEVTKNIEHIANVLYGEHDVLHFATKPVKVLKPSDSIKDAFASMEKLETSKIPIYQDGKYVGLLTMEEVAKWAIESHDTEIIQDILAAKKDEKVLFFQKNANIQDVVYAFEKALNKGNSLLAILITASGSTDEKPVGIITVADLPKIISNFI